MQPQAKWSFGTHPLAPSSLSQAPAGDPDDAETLMALINRCVDALHIMQERMAGLEEFARKTGDTAIRDKTEIRADVSTLRTRVKLAESTVEQMALRLSACESSATAQARDVAAVRSDAETWRRRAEADLVRLNAFENRLETVETRIERRLEQTESTLAAVTVENTELRARAEDGEAAAADLAAKLSAAGQAIADQRARLVCMQAKLVAATEMRTFAQETAAMNGHGLDAAEGGIIDLATLADDRRTSAA